MEIEVDMICVGLVAGLEWNWVFTTKKTKDMHSMGGTD